MDWTSVAEGLKVTISLGVAVQRPGDALSALMARAEEALYRAKNGGRNRCEQG
jgi:PleD family two-component response regulator